MGKKKDKKKGKKKDKDLVPEDFLQALEKLGFRPAIVFDERKAAAKTVAVLTAAQAIFDAHDDDDMDCEPFHDTLTDMVHECVSDPITASTVIKHLATIGAGYLTPEELQSMAMDLARNDD